MSYSDPSEYKVDIKISPIFYKTLTLSGELVDVIQFSKMLGYADVDTLIQEMLLNRGNH